jgi:hypothetical protein
VPAATKLKAGAGTGLLFHDNPSVLTVVLQTIAARDVALERLRCDLADAEYETDQLKVTQDICSLGLSNTLCWCKCWDLSMCLLWEHRHWHYWMTLFANDCLQVAFRCSAAWGLAVEGSKR